MRTHPTPTPNTYACIQCGEPATPGENFGVCDYHALVLDHMNWSVEGGPWPLLQPNEPA